MDETYLQRFLSDSARNASRSDIRELLKLLAKPEIISLAGGLPSPETFPVDEMADLLPDVLRRHGRAALQYGPTEGDIELRQELCRIMADDGVPGLTLDRLVITTAAQQGLDLCARVFLAHGDTVVCSLPSYLGALGAFSAVGARLCGIPIDDDGMRTDLLEQRLVDLRGRGHRPKLVYVVPDFQNPAGVTLSRSRRDELLEIAREFDLLVVEDSPYRHLRYVGESIPSLAELDSDGRVISLFTFSKILFPGIRLGWVVAAPEILFKLVTAKQSVDLCSSPLSQVIAREFLKTGQLPVLVERNRKCYSVKRVALLEALERHIDPGPGIRWTRPEGGMFVWMTLPPGSDARRLLQLSLEENVAFVCGSAFHCDGSGDNTVRLNFSYPSVEQLDEAIRRLARAVARLLAERPAQAVEPPIPSAEPVLVGGEHALDQLSMTLAMTELIH